MAMASVNITCTHCGKTFEHRKSCYNRREADQHEAWARENVTLCPECRAAQKKAALLEKLPTLPAIEGVSEKQVAYADSLRTKYIDDHMVEVKQYQQITRTLTPEEQAALEAACKAQGIDPADAVRVTVEQMQLQKTEIAMTETSARKIIDALK